MRILVSSVHAPSDIGPELYALQKRFVQAKTRAEVDYKLVLNQLDSRDFDADDVLLVNSDNVGHAPALRQIVDHFRSTDHDAYLILDSDCFPCRDDWNGILMRHLQRHDKTMAAAIRAENLDTFPHPCAFFITRQGLDDPRLNFDDGGAVNLLGKEPIDVGGQMQGMTDAVLPMMRTNIVNVHPLAAGVYHHLFYHHNAGSRDFHCRIVNQYKHHLHWYDHSRQGEHVQQISERLFRDPEAFIAYLTGESEPTLRPYLRGVPASTGWFKQKLREIFRRQP